MAERELDYPSMAQRLMNEVLIPREPGNEFGVRSRIGGGPEMMSEALRLDPTRFSTGEAALGLAGGPSLGSMAIFAGPMARTANQRMLQLAQGMAQRGASRDDIWRDTGWFQGAEGKWRFEIPDKGANAAPGFRDALRADEMGDASVANVGALMRHPRLYENYPDLARIQGIAVRDAPGGAYYGEGLPDLRGTGKNPLPRGATAEGSLDWHSERPVVETIQYGGESAKHHKSVALHELQHGVQNREGFARGGNPSDRSFQDIAQGIRDRAQADVTRLQGDLRAFQDRYLAERGIDMNSPGYDGAIQQAIKAWRVENPARAKQYDDAWRDIDLPPGMGIYKRLAGEVEARNVQRRMDLTAEQRQRIPPWETQDFPFEQQVVLPQRGQFQWELPFPQRR